MRRNTIVMLTIEEVTELFQQQTTLSVRDALGIIHEAQDIMSQEDNMVCLQAERIYGVFQTFNCHIFIS